MVTALDKNTALVLIDLQKGIVGPHLAHPIDEVLENVAQLTDAFRNAQLPIVIVHVNPSDAPWTKARKEPQPTSPAPKEDFLEIVPQVKTEPSDIFITKKTWNAFFGTELHAILQQRNVTGILLGGVSTSVGVEGTARAASELGYNITFAKNAMTDRLLEAHENSVKNIFPKMGEIDDAAAIIGILSKPQAS